MLLRFDGRIATLVGTAHMVAASQIRYQFQMRLQHDGVEELNAAIVLELENREIYNIRDFN